MNRWTDGRQWVNYRSDFSTNLISREQTFSVKHVRVDAADLCRHRGWLTERRPTKTYSMATKPTLFNYHLIRNLTLTSMQILVLTVTLKKQTVGCYKNVSRNSVEKWVRAVTRCVLQTVRRRWGRQRRWRRQLWLWQVDEASTCCETMKGEVKTLQDGSRERMASMCKKLGHRCTHTGDASLYSFF